MRDAASEPVLFANSSSTWIGEKSPVIPANRCTSVSATVLVKLSTWPSGIAASASSIVFVMAATVASLGWIPLNAST